MVTSVAVLWQNVFQAVVCALSAVRRAARAETCRSEYRDILIVSFNISNV